MKNYLYKEIKPVNQPNVLNLEERKEEKKDEGPLPKIITNEIIHDPKKVNLEKAPQDQIKSVTKFQKLVLNHFYQSTYYFSFRTLLTKIEKEICFLALFSFLSLFIEIENLHIFVSFPER